MHKHEQVISTSAEVHYRTGIIQPNGYVHWRRKGRMKHNLITDAGLNEVAAREWAKCFEYGAIGTSNSPVERSSGATTITAVGATVTASAPYFEAGDVGRLLRAATGQTGYITVFNTAQNVTWVPTGTDFSAQAGVIYYVNRTALGTEYRRTNTYRTTGSDNVSIWNGPNSEWSLQRTYLYPVETAPVTIRELGWSWGTTGTNLFGLDVLPGAGDALIAGQQYIVQVLLILRFLPAASTPAPNVGTNWNTTGNISVVSTNEAYSVAIVNSVGATVTGGDGLEPGVNSGARKISLYSQSSYALPGSTNTAPACPTGTTVSALAMTLSAYTPGSFTRTKSVLMGVSEVVGSWWGVMISHGTVTPCVAVKFNAAQSKDNTHTLSVSFRFTWGRRFPAAVPLCHLKQGVTNSSGICEINYTDCAGNAQTFYRNIGSPVVTTVDMFCIRIGTPVTPLNGANYLNNDTPCG